MTEVPEELIERVARAIYQLRPETKRWNGDPFDFDEVRGSDVYSTNVAFKQALAALRAVNEYVDEQTERTDDLTARMRLDVVATPTEDPERQVLTIGSIPIGDAILDAKGLAWSWQPRELGVALDVVSIRAIADTLTSIPLPSREAMETYYRAQGYLAEGESLGEHWGPPKATEESTGAVLPDGVTPLSLQPYVVSPSDGTVMMRATDEVIGSVAQGTRGWRLDSHLPLDYSGFFSSKREAAAELYASYLRYLAQDEHNRPID